jgi:hypothetical protein
MVGSGSRRAVFVGREERRAESLSGPAADRKARRRVQNRITLPPRRHFSSRGRLSLIEINPFVGSMKKEKYFRYSDAWLEAQMLRYPGGKPVLS